MSKVRRNLLNDAARAFWLGVAPMLVYALLLCPSAIRAQEASTPTAPRAQTPPPDPARPGAVRAGARTPTPRAPRAAPQPALAPSAPATPQARPAQPLPGVAPHAPLAPIPPRQIVTVVHRLRGWKLLAWLASNGPPALELDEFPSAADAHTNIVAGYVSDDGRTVVVRLPQAEAELESFPVPSPSGLFATADGAVSDEEAEYTLVLSDNRRVGAKFVGLDSTTGLSLLEAAEPVLSGAAIGTAGDTDDPTVGQRVRLYAPTPAARPALQTGVGYIYLSIDQKEGRLTEVRRGPSGKLVRVVARANVTPEWTGAVAANELGEVLGIVSNSESGETQIVPVATMLNARARVMKLRGSVPQPWLGVRGDASFQLKLDEWVSMGWKPELALPHIQNGQGVFLTAVAPGTPAALAGLRPGDVIASVGARDVRSVEDLSFTLNEAGVGSTIDFTVWRALAPSPLKLSVRLKGTQNPALATAQAEERAARDTLFVVQQQVRTVREEHRKLSGSTNPADAEAYARLSAQLRDAQERFENVITQVLEAEKRVAAARPRARIASTPEPGQSSVSVAPLQNFGLRAIGLTARGAARFGAKGGLLVIAVRPESAAAASDLRAGDIVETINGAVYAPGELNRLLSISETQSASLGVIREGHRLTLSLSPTAGRESK